MHQLIVLIKVSNRDGARDHRLVRLVEDAGRQALGRHGLGLGRLTSRLLNLASGCTCSGACTWAIAITRTREAKGKVDFMIGSAAF